MAPLTAKVYIHLDYTMEARMPLNIKNREVEELAAEVARLTGETKTEAIRLALVERRQRLGLRHAPPGYRRDRLLSFLEREIWRRVPQDQVGRAPDRGERERILGYGEEGV
jgi:antitoxin VapB